VHAEGPVEKALTVYHIIHEKQTVDPASSNSDIRVDSAVAAVTTYSLHIDYEVEL